MEATQSNVEEAQKGPSPTGSTAFDEARLVARAQAGDVDAFGDLVRAYQDRVYNVVFRMVGRAALAEELTQDAFLKAFEHIGRFDGRAKMYTWLFRIAVNLALSHRRRGRKVKFVSMDANSGNDETPARQWADEKADRPDEQAIRAETRQRVTDAIAELDEPYRAALVLRDIDGMDYAGIAEVLELTAGTVKSRIHRARLMLKEKLIDLMPN